MDLAQIAEMKNKIREELRQLDGLKQSMEHTLAGLIEWEKHLQSSPVKTGTRRPAGIKELKPKPQAAIRAADITPRERVNKALATVHGEFTRSQLLAETECDGKGSIDTAAYSNIFSRLLKRQDIQCVNGSPRQRDSLYMRSGEKKSKEVHANLIEE
jgi:hypothetical protein